MDSIEVPYSVFKEGVERANKLAYRPSEGLEAIVPFSVFEQGVKQANEKAYKPSPKILKNLYHNNS